MKGEAIVLVRNRVLKQLGNTLIKLQNIDHL